MTGTDGNVFNVLHNPSLGQVNLGGGAGSPLHKEDSPPRTVVLFQFGRTDDLADIKFLHQH